MKFIQKIAICFALSIAAEMFFRYVGTGQTLSSDIAMSIFLSGCIVLCPHRC